MAGRLKAGDRLSGTEKEQVKRNASIPKELDNSAGRSSESLSPTDKEGGWKVAEIISLDKEDVPKDFGLMRESLIVKAVDRFLRRMPAEFPMVRISLVHFHRIMKRANKRCCKRLSSGTKVSP